MNKPIKYIALSLGAMASTSAAIISIAPGDVTTSSTIAGFPRLPFRMVDGSGLTGLTHNNGANNEAWLSTGSGFGGIDSDPRVTLDLGAVYRIDSFNIWNYNEAAGGGQNRGVNSVSVNYGATAALGSTVPGITNFAVATGLDTYTGENFNGFAPFNARFIEFDINTNHGDTNTFYGLSEVQFDGVLVPEPTSSLLGGMALLGLLRRRR